MIIFTNSPVLYQSNTFRYDFIHIFPHSGGYQVNETPPNIILFANFQIENPLRWFFLLGFLLNDYFLQTITLFEYIPIFSWAYHSREYLLWRTVTYYAPLLRLPRVSLSTRPCLYSHAVILLILPSRPRGAIGKRSAYCPGGRWFAARLLLFFSFSYDLLSS